MNEMIAETAGEPSSEIVAILLATFNGAGYLREQLDSIAAQGHRNWRIVIADDGSEDGTLDVARQFSSEYPGSVQILEGPPLRSARDNFFRLLQNAGAAPYFVFCDQDDVWIKDKLELLVQRCKEVEGHMADVPCLVYSDLAVVDFKLQTLSNSFLDQIKVRPDEISYKNLLTENSIPGCAMLINAALVELIRKHPFDTKQVIMHDWWIALAASTLGKVAYVRKPLVLYRQHATNTLGSVNRSGILFTLSKVLRGDRFETLRTYTQAKEFIATYDDLLSTNIRNDIADFGSLLHRRKFARMLLIVKNKTLKQSFNRRIYQLLRA